MENPFASHSIPHSPMVPVDPTTMHYDFMMTGFSPAEYTTWIDESMSWKQACYIGDWSFLSKFLFKGPDALKMLASASVNSFEKFTIGQAKHCVMCNQDGKVVAEGVLMRRAEDEFLYTGGPNLVWAQYLLESGDYDATTVDIGPTKFAFQVSGPSALSVIEKATGENLRDTKFMHFRPATIDGRPVELLRQGMAGEIGFEIHGLAEDALTVYENVLATGREFGIRRLGVRAFGVNHVEACFPTGGLDYVPALFGESQDFLKDYVMPTMAGYAMLLQHIQGSLTGRPPSDFYRSPIELGWGRSVKFDHDFIGRDALEAELADPVRQMVTLEWDSEDVIELFVALFHEGDLYELPELPRAFAGPAFDAVLDDAGDEIGVSSSRCHSVYFRKMLSLCTVDVAYSEPGTAVKVLWGTPGANQKQIRATVAPAPYKQDNRRADLTRAPS